MISALVLFTDSPNDGHALACVLEARGLRVLATVVSMDELAAAVALHAPDAVVVSVHAGSDALFAGVTALGQPQPRPVLLWLAQAELHDSVHAVAAGAHHVLVGPHHPEPAVWPQWLALAQARWQQEQAQHAHVQDLMQRLEERKAVERAKGLLMQARQVSDDEAFRILRTVSMHANQRLGQVSQQIIHSAHFAESVNRAGQLRMLSQRLAKLYLLRLAGLGQKRFLQALQESVQRTDDHLQWLSRKLEAELHSQWVAPLQTVWQAFKAQLDAPLEESRWASLNELAETLLSGAEQLTAALETLGGLAPLHILNIAGRQRMLSQRYAKNALLLQAGTGPEAEALQLEMGELRERFEVSLARLNSVPLSTPDIRERLDTAGLCWRQMLHTAQPAAAQSASERKERLERLAVASETLLGVFDDLSVQYQHSLDMLLG